MIAFRGYLLHGTTLLSFHYKDSHGPPFFTIVIIGASLSEPHTSEKLVLSSRIQTSTRKSERIPYLVGTVVSRIQTTPTKSEQIHIWLV